MNPNWSRKTIDDVCVVANGATPRTGEARFWGGPHKWVTPAEMGKRTTPCISETARTLTKEGLDSCAASPIPANSVILSSRAPIGHLVINTVPMSFNQGCKGLIPRNGLDHKFLYYYLFSKVDELNDLGTGATFKEISAGNLKKVPIPLPPLSEQQRIVAILDQAFENIAKAKANAERKLVASDDLFRTELERVFNDLTISGEEIRLAELGLIQTGTTPSTRNPKNFGDDVPFVKPADFRNDGTIEYANNGLSNAGARLSRIIPENSTLMVCIGATIGKCGYTDRTITCNQQINAITPKKGVSHSFLYFQFLTTRFQKAVLENSGQATLPIINKSKWSNLKVCLPKEENQQVLISEYLGDLREQISKLSSNICGFRIAIDNLSKSLLHQAFSGGL